jgi:hypothetical protein
VLVSPLGLAGVAWLCAGLSVALLGATTRLGRAFETRRDADEQGP